MMDIQYRAARDEELETCVALQHRVFRPNQPDAPARYRAYVREDPSYRLGQTRVAVVDGVIVGHLRVWERVLNVRGVLLRAAGIGSLLSLPEFRGNGIATGLLDDAERYFVEEAYDLGLLFTIIGTPYYDARGWTPLPLPTFKLSNVPGSGVVGDVESLAVARDLAEVRALYEVERGASTGACERHAAYWDDGPARLRGLFPSVGVRRDGRLVAYANWDEEEDRVWVTEACALEAHEDAYDQLAKAVVSQAGSKSIEGSLRTGHPFVRCIARATKADPLWSTHDEMMVKMTDWDRLSEQFRSAGIDVGRDSPKNRTDADVFWRVLFGCPREEDRKTDWWVRIGDCLPLFYAWGDIF